MIPFLAGFALGIVATVAALILILVSIAMFIDEEANR